LAQSVEFGCSRTEQLAAKWEKARAIAVPDNVQQHLVRRLLDA